MSNTQFKLAIFSLVMVLLSLAFALCNLAQLEELKAKNAELNTQAVMAEAEASRANFRLLQFRRKHDPVWQKFEREIYELKQDDMTRDDRQLMLEKLGKLRQSVDELEKEEPSSAPEGLTEF